MRFIGLMRYMRLMIGRCALDVRRSTFLLLHRHEFHPALRTIPRSVSYDFGMHQAGVFLFCLVLLLLLVLVLATRMLRERRDGRGQYSCAHEQNCKFVSHLI